MEEKIKNVNPIVKNIVQQILNIEKKYEYQKKIDSSTKQQIVNMIKETIKREALK